MTFDDTMNEGFARLDDDPKWVNDDRFSSASNKTFYGEKDGNILRWFHTEAYAYARLLNMAGLKIEALKDVYEGGGYFVDGETTYCDFARLCGATYEDAGWMVAWDGNEGEGQPLRMTGWFRVVMGNEAHVWFADGSMAAYNAWDQWRNENEERKALITLIERMAHHRDSGIHSKEARIAVLDALFEALLEVA